VVKGMSLDPRIGGQFFNAGLGFGGSCFPKDVAALNHIGKRHGVPFRILPGVLETNKRQRDSFVRKVAGLAGPLRGKTLAVWGLAFKPDTDDLREAPSLDILPKLLKMGARIRAYDPVAMPLARKVMPKVKYCANAYEAAKGADAVLILTEWNEFKEVDLHHLKNILKRPLMVDGRNLYDPSLMAAKGYLYAGMGRGIRPGRK
jgi:UDPglucose 6-dehydrogenase